MKNLLFFAILSLLSLSTKAQVAATDTIEEFVLTKIDGTEYIGAILSDDGREVLIETKDLGKIYIPKSEVRSIVKLADLDTQIVGGQYQSAGPFTTRYAFTNNALPIKKGENYSVINLYGPEVHFAVSDNFNIGIMSTWIASPMVLAMKYTFKKEESNVNFSAGTLLGTSGYLNSFRGVGGLHWLSFTQGNRLNNITFSLGYGYATTGTEIYIYEEGHYENEYPDALLVNDPLTKGPIISIAGIFKVGAKASFFFDSMFGKFSKSVQNQEQSNYEATYDPITGQYSSTFDLDIYNTIESTAALFIMPGMRFQKTDNKAFQISLAGVTVFREEYNNSFPLPMLSWFYKF